MSSMPPDYPDVKDFKKGDIRSHSARFDFHRDPGAGGKNVAVNLYLPEEGNCLIEFEIEETSNHNTRGSRGVEILKKSLGVVNVPVGIRIGHRMDPDKSPVGAGAGFTGYVHMKYTSQALWLPAALKQVK